MAKSEYKPSGDTIAQWKEIEQEHFDWQSERTCKNCKWQITGNLGYPICGNHQCQVGSAPDDFGCNQWEENGGKTIAERLEKFDSEQMDDVPNAIVGTHIVVGVTKEEYRNIIKEA